MIISGSDRTLALLYWKIGALVIGFSFVLLQWTLRHQHEYAFTHDSAFYLDMARALAAGMPPTAPPWGLDNIDTNVEAVDVFPPGYGALLAFLSTITGFDVVSVAPWVNRFSAALIPFLLIVLFKNVASIPLLLCVGILALTGSGLQGNQFYALTDSICLTLCILAIGLVTRSMDWRSALFAGIAAGLAYTIRNAALALLVAVPVWYSFLMAGKTYDRGTLVRSVTGWIGGVIIATTPLLIYNVISFGSLMPYRMPPATMGVSENVTIYFAALLGEVVGAVGAGKAVYRPFSLTLVVCSFTMLLVIPLALMSKLDRYRYACALLLLLFVFAGSAVVIYAGIKYQSTGINHRHVLQYAWALLLAGGILLPPFLTRGSRFAAIGLLIVFVLLRAYDYSSSGNVTLLGGHTNNYRSPSGQEEVTPYTIANDRPLRAVVTALHRQGAFIASDKAWIFRIEDSVPVRHLFAGYGTCSGVEEEVTRLDSIGNKRAVHAVLTKLISDNPCRVAWAHHLDRAGFSIVFETANAVVYSKTARPQSPHG